MMCKANVAVCFENRKKKKKENTQRKANTM